MTASNAQQMNDWNGQTGQRWVANQARLDNMLDVFGTAAIRAAEPAAGKRILDIGCGAGATTLALASHVGPSGHVMGVDISEPLLARAREVAPPDAPVAFAMIDAARGNLGEHAFDLLFSRFGVMFFDDPDRAFAHMRGALKPGGRLAFACWRGAEENDWIRLPMGAIRGIVPPAPPPHPDAPGPFSFGDPDRIRRILAAAGFVDISITPFDHAIPFGWGQDRAGAVDDAVAMAFEVGPLSRALADQQENVRERAAAAVRAAFAQRPGERSVMIDGAAWIVTARDPG